VAGSIALWLEADPTLTFADVLDIIQSTATVDSYVTSTPDVDPVQWGAGKFNAYAGLKEVLNRKADGINEVNAGADHRLMVQPMGGNVFNIYLEGEHLSVDVYSTLGVKVLSRTISEGHEMNLDLSNLTHGIYVITVNGRFSRQVSVN
jgi:hypothetical protein